MPSTPRFGDLSELTQALNDSPRSFLGVIVATTTKNNSDTATPFNAAAPGLQGKTLLIQADTACYIYTGPLNTQTVTGTATGNGFLLEAGKGYTMTMGSSCGYLACVAVTGTSNLKVWECS